jgi:hypothetical protein
MRVIEVKANENVCCPICNKIILANDGESSPQECPHTLLIATDEGIDFCADAFNADALEEIADESSWDDAISDIDKPKAILIKMYEDAPSFFGAYFLFEK